MGLDERTERLSPLTSSLLAEVEVPPDEQLFDGRHDRRLDNGARILAAVGCQVLQRPSAPVCSLAPA